MNCCVPVPAAIDDVAGVTAMLVNVAAVTVSALVPETLPEVALMVEEPAATRQGSSVNQPPRAWPLAIESFCVGSPAGPPMRPT